MFVCQLFTLLLLFLCAQVGSECPNACNAHGKCGQYDMCLCHRNWMGEDCSQRMCQFGSAYVDSPKGDLDSSKGYLSGPDKIVAVHSYLYPEGTTEQYPQMTTSRGDVLSNTAHEYRECSNAGYCNRETGECECFPGYEGSACQRLSCPTTVEGDECSGHGTCQSISELAQKEAGNHYRLWDEDVTMGCQCDGQYTGSACEERRCKLGYDPLYPTIHGRRYANISYAIYTESAQAQIGGEYALRFFDAHGEDWDTGLLPFGADCATIIASLEALPNQVVPRDSVHCLLHSDLQAGSALEDPVLAGLQHLPAPAHHPFHGIQYTLLFPENPGQLRPLEVIFHCDGPRATLSSNKKEFPAKSFVSSGGFTGEQVDLFPLLCEGVTVTLATEYDTGNTPGNDNGNGTYDYLTGLSSLESRLLQRCLGDSDANPDTYVTGTVYGKTYHWDHGTTIYPHLVKLVPVDLPSQLTDICDGTTNNARGPDNTPDTLCAYPRHRATPSGGQTGGEEVVLVPGFLAPVIFDPAARRFVLFSSPAKSFGPGTQFHLFATSSVVQAVNALVSMISDPLRPYSPALFSLPTHLLNTSSHSLGGADYANPDLEIYGNMTTSGDLGCEGSEDEARSGAVTCVDRGDRVLFFSPDLTPAAYNLNQAFLDIYEIRKIGLLPNTQIEARFGALNVSRATRQALFRHELVLDRAVAGLWTGYVVDQAGDLSPGLSPGHYNNTATGILGYGQSHTNVKAYKLLLSDGDSDGDGDTAYGVQGGGVQGVQGVRYVSECSNRGLCQPDSGLCECFAGFTGDACSLFHHTEL